MKYCCVCNSSNKVCNTPIGLLCGKHYMQYRRYGKVLNRTKFDPNKIILESDMAKIVLYNKNGDKIAEALIDTEDIGKISSDKWCIDKNNYVKNSKQEYLHRVILGAPKDMCVDHINGNTLDNRKNNLRICTNRENTSNRTKLGTNNTSGILGVRFDNRRNKWYADIQYKGKCIFLEYFNIKEDAIKARIDAEKSYFKEFKSKILNNEIN